MSVAVQMDGHSGHDTLSHCMKDYKHGPNSRMSITFNSSKGLTNAPGQNNCFLNSAVQVLWHLDAFRRSFRLLSGHSCMGNACIFCALKVMFTQFQYSDKQVLPPDALRQALSETFQNQQRFQMGYMDDAAECFENILTRIHNHIAAGESEDCCTVAHCLPHRKFSMAVSEQVVCGSCGSKSEPFTFNEMVFYVSTGALVTEFKSHSTEELSNLSFSQLLKSTVTKGDIRACPVNCGEFGEKRRHLSNIPDVVSIGLVWESAKSGSQHIRDVVNGIGTTLDLTEMFHSTPADGMRNGVRKQAMQPLQLVGVVCYYGKHYSTFFFHSKVHEWIYFDDASVKQISSSWSKVCEKLCKGRHQPLLLLYMNPNTDAVDVSSAPKFSTMAPGYEWKSEDHTEPVTSRCKPPPPEPNYSKSKRDSSKHETADSRYDEADAAYATRHFYKERRRHYSEKLYDRQPSTALSRQDSGVSTQSSKSQSAADDSASRISAALTQHSSDSGSSGHQLSRQESDTASSYCSRSSMASTLSTFSSAVESEDTGYAGLHASSYQSEFLPNDTRADNRPKASLKKKKMKNRMEADIVRYHSKSQASLLDVHNTSYDDSSLPRDKAEDVDPDQKSFSYATLPRKKRSTPASPANPVKGPEIAGLSSSTTDSVVDQEAPNQSISSRIQMFNGICDQTTPPKRSNKPPELKPLLNLNNGGKDGDSPSYISRSSVEKILNQQKKVSSRTPTKMLRPTYEEEFSVPEEYISDIKKSSEVRYDSSNADITSIGSLKDSGYRSLGDRGSNSASSVSSFSTGSPTQTSSFTFDTKEHIYYEPPPVLPTYERTTTDNCIRDEGVNDDNAEEYEFPPPPPELLEGGKHTKQLSEASILSEASTLRQRRTPSVESLDALPTAYVTNHLLDSVSNLSVSDSKLKSVIKSAEDFLEKSVEHEELHDINSALVFARQSASLLSSVLNQRPEDKHLERFAQSKYDYCMNRVQTLQNSVPAESGNSAQQGKHVMAELHIDNQTRRGTASSDYTPLHNAIHRAPALPARDSSHRLSRTDSQISNSSSGSAGHRSTTSTSTAGDTNHAEKVVHTVPPQLQRSISQLQQKQQLEQSQRQLSLPAGQPQKYNTSASQHNHMQQMNLQQANKGPQRSQPGSNSRHSSNSSLDSDTRSNSKPSNGLYREYSIPTTLQRMDYIRDGYKCRGERQGCPSPSVIPPPKEFQESTNSSVSGDLQASSHNARLPAHPKRNTSPQQNGTLYGTQTNSYSGNNNYVQPTSSQPSYPRDNYRDLPPKQNINKQNIRDLLVQDMLKRKGQQGPSANHNVDSAQPSAYLPATNSAKPVQSYADDFDEPLWTPPQQSSYDRGLSHYDKPNYHRQNLYGQVNRQQPTNRYTSNPAPQQSLYGENVAANTRRPITSQHEPRINHCHTYSTEL